MCDNQIILTAEEKEFILKRRARLEKKALSNVPLKDVLKNYPTVKKMLKVLQLPDISEASQAPRHGFFSPAMIDGKLFLYENYSYEKYAYQIDDLTFYTFNGLKTFLGKKAYFTKESSPDDCWYPRCESYSVTLIVVNGRVIFVKFSLFGKDLPRTRYPVSKRKDDDRILAVVSTDRSFYLGFYYDCVKDLCHYPFSDIVYNFKGFSRHAKKLLAFRKWFAGDKRIIESLKLSDDIEELINVLDKKGGN